LAQRSWEDKSGKYQVDGDLIAFNDHLVIVKRSDGDLLSLAIDELSDKDREFLNSKEANSGNEKSGVQKWSLANGLQILGQVVAHEEKDVVIQRRRGALYVNDRPIENLPPEYKKMLPAVVGHFENRKFDDLPQMETWFNSRYGYRPAKYHCEGVRMAMENRDEYVVPYFLFADSDRKFLEEGGEEARKTDSSSEERQVQDLYMEVRAAEYQRAREERQRAAVEQQQRAMDLQIKRVQLGLLAVAADVVDMWEVALIPPGGSIYQAQLVVVPAQNSLQASQLALAQWPGYSVGPVRRVNRNR
jgi:hypothetical protein